MKQTVHRAVKLSDKDVVVMFVKTVRRSSLLTGLLLIGVAVAGAALLIWPQAAASGVSRGLSICSSVIIPSLFPFLVLSGFLVRSGLSVKMGRRLDRVTRFLFGLPGCCGAGILIGFIGGYPAGGVAAGELVERGDITREEGRRMLRFCVNGGPAFIISAVGTGLMGQPAYGFMLYGAHIAAALILGIAGRFHGRGKDRGAKQAPSAAPLRHAKPPHLSVAAAFVESVNAACRSLLYMCGFVVLFAAILSLCDASGVAEAIRTALSAPFRLSGADTAGIACLFPCLLEVSCGCVEAAASGPSAPFLLGMALGWGGLSVHCQLSASLHRQRLIDRSFFAARGLHALLGGILTMVLFRFVPVAVNTGISFSETVVKPYTTSVTASTALLLMCALFLLALATNREAFSHLHSGGGN